MKKSRYTDEQIAFALKQLEDENRQLKRLVADLSLDKHILQDVLAKSSDAWAATRTRRVRPGVPC